MLQFECCLNGKKREDSSVHLVVTFVVSNRGCVCLRPNALIGSLYTVNTDFINELVHAGMCEQLLYCLNRTYLGVEKCLKCQSYPRPVYSDRFVSLNLH